MIPDEPITPRDFLSLERFFGARISPEDSRVILVLVTAAVCLTLQHFGPALSFAWFLDRLPEVSWQVRFLGLMNWAAWIGLTYFLVPVLLSKLIFKEKLRNHGLKATGLLRNAWIYATALVLVLSAVWIVSGQQSFLSKYPFLPLPRESTSDSGEWWIYFGVWEIIYFLQFCALEYFFRGFLLFEMEKKFGFHAVFLAMIPYCMIHFQKPFLEAFGSIVAGIFLGMLALRTRSIFFGMALHCLVAASMDVAALLRKGSLPPFPWLVP